MNVKHALGIIATLVASIGFAHVASAQPGAQPQPQPPPDNSRPPDDVDEATPPPGEDETVDSTSVPAEELPGTYGTPANPPVLVATPLDGRPFERREEKPSEKFTRMPLMFNTATADLPPAGRILMGLGVDTGGAISTDARIGLGDVAEFGVGTTDLIRVRRCAECDAEAVKAYPVAMFKMGISENRLFQHQPALALGFRKSFEREHDNRASRVAELYLVGSKQLGSITRLHLGGVFWDAEVARLDDSTRVVTLHERGLQKQLRAFGGIEVAPLPRSRILVEVGWIPEFKLDANNDDKLWLRPMLTWGVRYELAPWAVFESGVRVPDIGDVNLIDAQIFGQLRIVSDRFARFIDNLQ